MASSTNIKSGGLASVVIKINGEEVPDELCVLGVAIEKKVNRIATARFSLRDGQPDTAQFPASSSPSFVPGAQVSIEAGYDTKTTVLFTGIITSQSIRVDETEGSSLEIECRDPAIRMVVGRKSATWSTQKDSDTISSIISTYEGLSAKVTDTGAAWPQQVQYYATDWDFILSLADANGLIVTTLNGSVAVFSPGENTSPVLSVGYGDGLLDFSADMNSVSELGSVKAFAWDYTTQAIVSGEATSDYAGPGNLSSKDLSDVVGLADYQLQSPGPLQSADLTNWSNAQIMKSEYSKIQGEARFQGTSLVDPGKYITLTGLGERFSGNHIISGVTHNLADGNWITEVSIGLSPDWFTAEVDVTCPPASGLLPGVTGLFNGTVKKMSEDPNSQFRILVDIPLFDQNGQGLWARLSNFYSTSGAGAFFLPEVGDEVVVGFLNGDPRYPIILGSLYSSSQITPYTGLQPNEKNSMKAIVSKSGILITFDDENKILTVATPDKNTMVLSDKDKQITVQDENGNSMVMSSDGITIKSPKTINIQADQIINIKGMQGINIQSSGGDVDVTAMNIKETADMQYSAEGSMTAKINSGTELTLSSAMIMIN